MDFSENNIYIKVKDHSVSGEEFSLLLDDDLQLLKTYPQPTSNELGRYYESEDYISHTDNKRSLFEKAYHIVKVKALKDKVSILENEYPAKGKLLDIGAGTGDFLLQAKQAGWDTTGIEPNAKAKNSAESKGVTFINDTSTVGNNTFDAVTMWHVLEHVPNVQKQITELNRIVKPNGIIIIAVPNFNSYDAKYYGKHWAAYDVPRHLWHFSKTAIKNLFESQGMKLVKILPMKFDSFYVSLLSEKYKTGKMNFIKGFITGLRSNLKAAKNSEYSSHIYIIKNNKN